LFTRRIDPSCLSNRNSRVRHSSLETALRFARIGAVSTICYAILFLILRGALGTYGANTLALVVCAVANVVAHEMSGAKRLRAGFSQFALVTGGVLGLATSLSLTSVAILSANWLSGSLPVVFAALMIATAGAAVIRFALLSSIEFRASRNQRVEGKK
jgi:hypothetical protein